MSTHSTLLIEELLRCKQIRKQTVHTTHTLSGGYIGVQMNGIFTSYHGKGDKFGETVDIYQSLTTL